MSKVLCESQELINIANTIREKTGKSEQLSVSQMDEEIKTISGSVDYKTIYVYSVSGTSDTSVTLHYIDKYGDYEQTYLSNFDILEVRAPQLLVIEGDVDSYGKPSDNVGYYLENPINFTYDQYHCTLIYANIGSSVVFRYNASDNEPQ